jgi:hypothetical protein
MIHIEFDVIEVISLILITFFPFVFASVMTNFNKWKYYKKVYKELPNKKFYLWESADGNTITEDENLHIPGKFYRWRNGHYELQKGIYLNRNLITFFDPYSLYWLLKFDRYFKYNPVTDTDKKRNQRIDLLLK